MKDITLYVTTSFFLSITPLFNKTTGAQPTEPTLNYNIGHKRFRSSLPSLKFCPILFLGPRLRMEYEIMLKINNFWPYIYKKD